MNKTKIQNCVKFNQIAEKMTNVQMMAEMLTIEVYTESGKLKHLVNDKKMEEYITSLKDGKGNNYIICCLCDKLITKYAMDLIACGGIYYKKDKIICEDCAKWIAKQLIER